MKFWKNQASSGAVLNEYNFGYNTANQIISITEPTARTRTFGYDDADRLTSATSTLPNQNESYTFDDVGNRTSSHLSSTYGYQQGAFNRLTATQQASYTFDANGNVTSKSEGTNKWYYSYDRENRLTNATKFGGLMPRAGESIVYQYDALGRRVIRQDKKTGRTEFTHDGLDIIQDRKLYGDTTTTTNYVNGLGIDDKLKITSGTTSKYFLTDHLGSTVGLADSSGTVSDNDKVVYDSFGRETFNDGVTSQTYPTRYRYTGREADGATGLMYYRARFYDPQVGRFTSEDPIGLEGGINSYAYVGNSPLDLVDPLGLQNGPRNPLRDTYDPQEWIANGVNNTVSDLLWLDNFASWSWTAGNSRCSTWARIKAMAKIAGAVAFIAVGGTVISKIGGRILGAFSRGGASATPRLVHLTNSAGAAGIDSSGTLVGNIYAGPISNASSSGLRMTARTGLSPGAYQYAVPIPAAGNTAFSKVVPVGPITTLQAMTGTQYTARGTLNLTTGAFTRTGVNRNQAGFYAFDATATTTIATSAVLISGEDCLCP